MSDKSWKQHERQAARLFNTTRTPLSGGGSRHTRSDTLHDELFVESKYRKKHTVYSLFDETATLAQKEGKLPVLALKEAGRHGFLCVIHARDIQDFVKVMNGSTINDT